MITAGEFRRRAGFEAARYGADPWVFVRELIQNSRDAGAGRIELEAERRGGRDRVLCRDDGAGMSFEHARRYLFTLYASSKRGAPESAGRFGIGFWSVLRFGPEEVVVRSAPADGPAWQLRSSGDLELVELGAATLERGTEVELVRAATGEAPEGAVWRAVRRDARYLRRRATDAEGVVVLVNGRPATTELELPPPSLGFDRPGLRGSVALAAVPRVDLLAHGLRVRSAATLDELLTEPGRDRRRRSSSLPEGLVPQLVLDSRRLRVLMSRGDARSDAELRRVVAAGRRALRRLVRHQLDRGAGLGRVGRAAMRLREALASRWRLGAAALTVLALAVTAVLSSRVPEPSRPDRPADRRRGQAVAGPGLGAVLAGDIAERYPGPAAEAADRLLGGVALRYRPLGAEPMLGLFRVDGVDDRGRVVRPPQDLAEGSYRGVVCRADCLEIELELAAGPGPVRLPVPTGHRLDPSSLSFGAGGPSLRTAADGGPILVLESAFRGRLRYRTGPASGLRPPPIGTWPTLPPEAAALADSLEPLAPEDAAARAADWVRGRVAYDASPATAERHRAAAGAGLGFAERCLAVAAGDCDVQATLAAAIAARAGVPVRLAVGWVGVRGRALPGLHAWLEVLGRDGIWRAEDVSEGVAGSPAAAAGSEPSARAATRPGPLEPSPLPGDDGLGTGWTLPAAFWLALAAAASTAAGVAAAGRRRLRHRHRPAEMPDLAGLVRGALARPEAYSEVPALFERRIVPCHGDAPISLRRARRLAGRGELAVAARAGDLSRRAADSGCGVVDGSRAEGRAAAAALGAVDLDRWQRLLAVGRRPPEARRIEDAAASVGERWRVLVSRDTGDEVAVLDGQLTGREGAIVALSEGSAAWCSVAELAANRPAAAALLLAEIVLDALEWPSWRRRPVLEGLAGDAIGEAAEAAS